MDNVEEAADSLDTNDDFTIMYTTNTVEYRNVNVFEIVWTPTVEFMVLILFATTL